QRGKRREIDPKRCEVQRLHAGDRTPQPRIDAPCVNPWIDGCDAGGLPIDRNLCLSEGGSRTALQFTREWIRNARIPEFVTRLTLRIHVEDSSLDVQGKRECAGKLLRSCEIDGAAVCSGRQRQHDVRWSRARGIVVAIGACTFSQRIKLKIGASKKDTGEGGVHKVA